MFEFEAGSKIDPKWVLAIIISALVGMSVAIGMNLHNIHLN